MTHHRHQCDHLGSEVVVGARKHSDPSTRHTRFAKLVSSDFVPPTTMDLSPAALALLALVLGNANYGDCVFAAGYHIVACETANAGDAVNGDPQLTEWALSDYSAVTGFDPSKPETDQGTDPATALAFWESNGFRDGTKLTGHVEVNAANPTQLKQATFITGNAFIAMDLPDEWVAAIQTMGPGFVWDKAGAPNPQNGHMVMAVGYTTTGLIIDTWGILGILTWGALATYGTRKSGGEVYSLLTPDQVSRAKAVAPNGLDWRGIEAAFDTIGGSVPIDPPPEPPPAPEPPPPAPPAPTPAPGAAVTLAQATEWATAPFLHHACPPHVTRANAIHAVTKALKEKWPKA
jgi:hypothetical protein